MTRGVKAILASLALFAGACAAQAQQVRTESGVVEGTVSGGVESWKAIPFAQPPVGNLRWRAPEPVVAWQGVRAAKDYGHDCMQLPFPSDAAPLGTRPSEDCLTLNIWRPSGHRAGRKLPVVMWIYGGGFVNGGSSPPTYSGAALARQGVIFVSFNYRLGRFGTFAHPQLSAEAGANGPLGNYDHMDQIAALQWVHRNIAAFGGDPDNVTIMGESAGGMSVHALMTSPAVAKGLFHRAIIMSGGDATATGSATPGQSATLAEAEQVGTAFAKAKGIDPADPDALAKLRALPAPDVVDGINLATLSSAGSRSFSRPFADGRVVTEAKTAYATGAFAHVPVMIGATDADLGGPDGFMVAGATRSAAAIAASATPVFLYRFSYVARVARGRGEAGAKHATDIPFFLDTADVKYGADAAKRDLAMARTISAYVVNFVKHSDPNGRALPEWPAYGRKHRNLMDFSRSGRAHLSAVSAGI